MRNAKKWEKYIYASEKEKNGLIWLAKIYIIFLITSIIISILYKYTFLKEYLGFLVNTDTEYPIYLFLLAVLFGVPIMNTSKQIIDSYNQGKAIFLVIIFLLSTSAILIVTQILLAQVLPTFTNIIKTLFIISIIILGIYSYISDKLKKGKE